MYFKIIIVLCVGLFSGYVINVPFALNVSQTNVQRKLLIYKHVNCKFRRNQETNMKRKRVSKRNKLAWRKHTNVKDVEEFLEDQLLDQRLGVPLSKVKSEELFQIDIRTSLEPLSSKEKCRLKLKNPKCFSILKSNVPAITTSNIQRHSIRKENQKQLRLKVKRALEKGRNVGIKRLKSTKKNQNEASEFDFNQDAWQARPKEEVEKNEWITINSQIHNLAGVGKLKRAVVASVTMKNTVLPSIEPPHPGTSYNPSYVDHQNLLKSIVEEETAFIKQEEHLNRVTTNAFKKVSAKQRDTSWLKEMSEGLPDKSANNNNSKGNNSYIPVGPKVENKKKTLQQKRKQKEQKTLKRRSLVIKSEKKKLSDMHNLKVIRKQIANEDKKSEKVQEKRREVAIQNKKKTKRLSATKFTPMNPEFAMASDLTGALRNVRKVSNLLLDRYKSLQQRNIIEPGSKSNSRRSKIKRFVRPGFKDDWKETVAMSKS